MRGSEKVYVLEDEQLALLERVEDGLYGDGTSLTPDTRRDLANTLNLVLGQIRQQKIELQGNQKKENDDE